MISSFRTFNESDNKITDFMRKLRDDISKMNDGEYLYAFLSGDEYGTNGKYVRLKIVKEENDFLGFIIKTTNDNGTIAGKLVEADVFKPSKDKDYAVGYCVTQSDAELVKILRAKNAIDKYCFYIGFNDLDEYLKEFKRFRDNFPEKII